MTTYTKIFYHLVFATKNRERILTTAQRRDLFAYIWGILKKKECHLYRINGVEDHLHLLISVHPAVTLADLVREIKAGSARWIKEENVFSDFKNWQEGYGAFTCSLDQKESLISYINSQEEHHRTKTFLDEYRQLLAEAGLVLDERYLP